MTEKIIAIVPAAGVGARANADMAGGRVGGICDDDGCRIAAPGSGAAASSETLPKQYRPLRGEPMLRWAVRALLADERVGQVRVVVAPGDALAEGALAGLPRTVIRPCGGPTRAATVLAALEDLAPEPGTWVLVHDAARPGLPPDDLRTLIDACLAHGAGGLLARRVADTVKQQDVSAQVGGPTPARDPVPSGGGVPGLLETQDVGVAPSGRIRCDVAARTLSREGLWLAQTPQMFPAVALLAALRRAAGDDGITDEASAMERAGCSPLLVPGSLRNFKVTWPEDFALMEKWLGS